MSEIVLPQGKVKGAFKVAEFEIEVALERFKVTLKYLAVP